MGWWKPAVSHDNGLHRFWIVMGFSYCFRISYSNLKLWRKVLHGQVTLNYYCPLLLAFWRCKLGKIPMLWSCDPSGTRVSASAPDPLQVVKVLMGCYSWCERGLHRDAGHWSWVPGETNVGGRLTGISMGILFGIPVHCPFIYNLHQIHPLFFPRKWVFSFSYHPISTNSPGKWTYPQGNSFSQAAFKGDMLTFPSVPVLQNNPRRWFFCLRELQVPRSRDGTRDLRTRQQPLLAPAVLGEDAEGRGHQEGEDGDDWGDLVTWWCHEAHEVVFVRFFLGWKWKGIWQMEGETRRSRGSLFLEFFATSPWATPFVFWNFLRGVQIL